MLRGRDPHITAAALSLDQNTFCATNASTAATVAGVPGALAESGGCSERRCPVAFLGGVSPGAKWPDYDCLAMTWTTAKKAGTSTGSNTSAKNAANVVRALNILIDSSGLLN